MTTVDPQCTCGCCDGTTVSTPRPIEQRHGLPAIEYRVGAHADFLDSLVTALSDEDAPALARLRSRDPRDFTMALLDGAATMCDVLTFATERLAQESYLGTARDRSSLRELGRLVAYRLRPGVSAGAQLAFFVQPPPSSPTATGAADEAFAPGPYLPGGVEVPAGLPVRSVPGPGEQPQTFETTEAITARPEWNALRAWTTRSTVFGTGDGRRRAYLDGTGYRLRPGDRLLFTSTAGAVMRTLTDVAEQPSDGRTRIAWAPDLTAADVSGGVDVHVFRKVVGIFGHSAPHRSLIHTDSQADWGFDIGIPGELNTVDLDGTHPDILAGSYLVLERDGVQTVAIAQSVRPSSKSAYALSGRITRVLTDTILSSFNPHLRDTAVHAASEPLPVAQEPDESPLTGSWVAVHGDADLPAGHRLLLSGVTTAGEPYAELLTLQFAWRSDVVSLLYFEAGMTQSYRRETVVLYGNVAAATHGETVHQVLGGGDGSAVHQAFELQHAPLTYVPSADPAGADSTLSVRVNDVEWQEVPTLYPAGPADRAYVTRETEKGAVTAVFGDGVRGSRLPTGQHNVRAEYRRGIGTAGNVAAGAISQVMDPPLGVTKATNPRPATGGADPEPASAARESIPLQVRTLGRAVSLVDYADFARAFAGIAKADATVLNLRGGRTIVVTVAAADGAPVPPDAQARLVTALRTYGDPMVSVVVLPHRSAAFRLALRFQRQPDRRAADVAAGIRAELAQAFAFAARGFGQPVHRSEVLATIHRVPGVVAVDLDKLYRVAPPIPPEPGWPPEPGQLAGRLLAARPRVTAAGTPLAAELLTIAADDPFDVLQEMS